MRTLLQHVEIVSPRETFLRSLAISHLSRHGPENIKLRGQRFATFANDWVGLHVNLDGYYERPQLDLVFRFLQPLRPEFSTGLALDIGANIGNHSVFFDKLFSRVVAFEPNPSTFQLLRFNATHGRHIEVHPFGLGDTAGRFTMRDNVLNAGGVHIDRGAKDGDGGIAIDVKRLDDCGVALDNLRLVKLDVEGFEGAVLRGGIATLEKHMPVVIFEQHADAFENGTTASIELLRSLGYAFCWEEKRALVTRWSWRRFAAWLDHLTGIRKIPHRIVSDPTLAPGTYELIIAVPPRHQPTLGL